MRISPPALRERTFTAPLRKGDRAGEADYEQLQQDFRRPSAQTPEHTQDSLKAVHSGIVVQFRVLAVPQVPDSESLTADDCIDQHSGDFGFELVALDPSPVELGQDAVDVIRDHIDKEMPIPQIH